MNNCKSPVALSGAGRENYKTEIPTVRFPFAYYVPCDCDACKEKPRAIDWRELAQEIGIDL